jgi:hypothetical protein
MKCRATGRVKSQELRHPVSGWNEEPLSAQSGLKRWGT